MSNISVRYDHKKKLIMKLKSAATFVGLGFVMSFDKLCILVMTEIEDLMKEMMIMVMMISMMMMITMMRVVMMISSMTMMVMMSNFATGCAVWRLGDGGGTYPFDPSRATFLFPQSPPTNETHCSKIIPSKLEVAPYALKMSEWVSGVEWMDTP